MLHSIEEVPVRDMIAHHGFVSYDDAMYYVNTICYYILNNTLPQTILIKFGESGDPQAVYGSSTHLIMDKFTMWDYKVEVVEHNKDDTKHQFTATQFDDKQEDELRRKLRNQHCDGCDNRKKREIDCRQ